MHKSPELENDAGRRSRGDASAAVLSWIASSVILAWLTLLLLSVGITRVTGPAAYAGAHSDPGAAGPVRK